MNTSVISIRNGVSSQRSLDEYLSEQNIEDTISAADKQIDYLDQRVTELETLMINPMEFGELKAEVSAQRRDLDRIVKSIDTLSIEVKTIRETLTEAKGGWRTLMVLGGIAASVGGAITYALQHIRIVP